MGLNLHTHLEGWVRPETAADLAASMGAPTPDGGWEHALRMTEPADLTVFLAHVAAAYPVLGSAEAMRRVAREAVEDAAADRCDYLELRFGPSTHARPGFGIPDVIAAACAGLEEGSRATGLPVGLVVCLLRHLDDATNLAIARAAADAAGHGVVGLDVAGDELLYPSLEPYREPYRIAAAAGLGLTAHAAEAGPASAARDAVEMLGVTRIGHGSHIADDTRGARLGRPRRRGDRGLPHLERPDRRRAVDPRAPDPRVPRGRLPGRDRRRQPDQHRDAARRRGAAARRGRRRVGGGHGPDPPHRGRGRVRRRARRALPSGRGSRPPSRSWGGPSATRSPCSGPSRPTGPRRVAIWAASQLTTPSWSHRQRAPISTASRACGTTSSERRKTSTMSNGPVASAASRSDRKAGIPRHAPLVRVDRHAVEALADEEPEHPERGPGLRRRRAHDRDPPRRAQDRRDLVVVGDRDRPALLLEVEEGDRPLPRLAIGRPPLVVGQLEPSLTYGCPSAAGATLRPTTPARTMIVRTYGSELKKLL